MDAPLVFLDKLIAAGKSAITVLDQVPAKAEQAASATSATVEMVTASTAAIEAEAARGVSIIRGATSQVETASRGLGETASRISTDAGAVGESARSAVAEVEAVTTSAQQALTAADAANAQALTVRERLLGNRTELAQLINTLEATASELPATAALLAQIESLFSGLQSVNGVAGSLNGALVQFQGESRTVLQLIQQLAPSAGEVQSRIREFLIDVKGQQNEVQQIVAALQADLSTLSPKVAELFTQVRDGQATLNDLQQLLAQLQQAGAGGSLANLLGQRLADLLRDGIDAGAFA